MGAHDGAIRCSKPLHKVNKNFTNAWGLSYEVGDDVVVSNYCQKWGTSEFFYVLLEAFQTIFTYSHLVRAIKFPMFAKHHHVNGYDHVYELFTYALDGMRSILFVLDVDD